MPERIKAVIDAEGWYKCILFFVHVVEVAGNIIPGIMVGYFVVT